MINVAENLKAALDGWFGDLTFWGVISTFLLSLLVPQRCEREPCADCPWDRDGVARRRFWTWRVRVATLWLVVDGSLVIYSWGRVVCDLVLWEVTWTAPIFAFVGYWILQSYLDDFKQLERARAERAKLPS